MMLANEAVLEQAHPETRALSEYLTAWLGDRAVSEEVELEAEKVWSNHPVLNISLGSVEGRVRHEGVRLSLGSMGNLIEIDVETPDGVRPVLLGGYGSGPSFDISPVKKHEYGLAVKPVAEDYIELPTDRAFDWQAILSQAGERREAGPEGYYLVVFRSWLKAGADTEPLSHHDALAHDAAKESPALLHYFAGEPDEHGRALSFCLWSDREEARQISKDPRHLAAMRMVDQYESYTLERYYIRLVEDEQVAFDKLA